MYHVTSSMDSDVVLRDPENENVPKADQRSQVPLPRQTDLWLIMANVMRWARRSDIHQWDKCREDARDLWTTALSTRKIRLGGKLCLVTDSLTLVFDIHHYASVFMSELYFRISHIRSSMVGWALSVHATISERAKLGLFPMQDTKRPRPDFHWTKVIARLACFNKWDSIHLR